ncbi:MAG TPA: ATP-binding cassette domain-containing protein [bacterium]|nr:ATP-binding cassette domain-containing protein [bacterium]
MAEEVILRFDNVDFEYMEKKPILDSASFSLRRGAKVTLMGQNGAGKSTIFGLIRGELKPKSGKISMNKEVSVGTARQMIAREDMDLSVEEYFARAFDPVPHNLPGKINKVMEAVNLQVPLDRRVGDLSGGQQARLLLAFALIENPDVLLLDEPTNNLDKAGIDHLIEFLVMYDKTVIVISHDADFLNCFTEGVIYLDVFTKQTELYVGDYYSVTEEIAQRVEREEKKNAQLQKTIQDRKEKVNFFANKGGKMRKLAKKMRDEIAESEENMVDVRREDKTIRDFNIQAQDISGAIVTINTVNVIINHEMVAKPKEIILRKRQKLLISGPNGIGKSTFLRSLVSGKNSGAVILPEVIVGYYSQDFANLDFNQTVYDSLDSARMSDFGANDMRSVAAGFLLNGELMGHRVGDLSEGQKGLLAFARLVLMKPGLLILDEPTNHINFRHIPVIAKALNEYQGTMIMISHMEEFVKEIKMDEFLELDKI